MTKTMSWKLRYFPPKIGGGKIYEYPNLMSNKETYLLMICLDSKDVFP